MLYHSPPHRTERMTKWMLQVASRRAKSRACRAAKVALVATRRVGVVPGVKMEPQRLVRKSAMFARLVGGLVVGG